MMTLQIDIGMNILSYLKDMMQLFGKLLLMQLSRIGIWYISNLIENCQCTIHKTSLPKYFP